MGEDTGKSTFPSQDERVMAALANISVLVPFMGLIAPIAIWATQKDKSAYVRFQALQAAAYQTGLILFWFAGMGSHMCSLIGTFLMIPLTGAAAAENNTLFGTYGANIVLRGRDFRYAIVGRRVEKYLEGQA